MTKLSVNINKYATLRNSRGGDNPNLVQIAKDIVQFGADGITVHPRPDERHIRYQDVHDLKKILKVEFNIEGNCREQKFIDLVLAIQPEQVTLVPDSEGQLTSDHGWDTIEYSGYLTEMNHLFQSHHIRTSIFVDPIPQMIAGAAQIGVDRIELYTEFYARHYQEDKDKAIKDYIAAAKQADSLGLEINAGHDLSLENLKFFAQNVKPLHEVSIGHALICDAIYYGLENTVQLYQRCLNK